MKTMGEMMEARKNHGNICFINMWYRVFIYFSANVAVQGVRHLVEGALEPIVGNDVIIYGGTSSIQVAR